MLKMKVTRTLFLLTIQNRVSFAKPAYSSIVESTLKTRQISTDMNLRGQIKARDVGELWNCHLDHLASWIYHETTSKTSSKM